MYPTIPELEAYADRIAEILGLFHPSAQDYISLLCGHSWQKEIKPDHAYFVFDEEAQAVVNHFMEIIGTNSETTMM